MHWFWVQDDLSGWEQAAAPWTQEHCVIEHILYQIEASQCFESVFMVTRSEVTELHRKVSAASLPCCPKLFSTMMPMGIC